MVICVDVLQIPLAVIPNSSTIELHAIIVVTGTESIWLNVMGECGGGGDTAEDVLVLARTSEVS